MFLIDGLFINKGGGAVLLDYLVAEILKDNRKDDFFFLLDPRYTKPRELTSNFAVVNNSLKDRFAFYIKNRGNYSTVLCFANVPPPIRLNVPVYTYFHNQKLLEAPWHRFEKAFLKLYLKFLTIQFFNRNTDFYIVQTNHMVSEILKLKLKKSSECLIIPFYDNNKYKNVLPFDQRKKNEFVFVSNPSPQKNYPTLLDAWECLLLMGYFPVLHVTVDETAPHVLEKINLLNEKGAKIINHKNADPRELYYSCQYLVFPSVMESFGLPLVEAVESGMKVIASDLEYVSDVISPSCQFNPFDKNSIAEAVIYAISEQLPESQIKAKNEIKKLINLFY